MKDEGTRFYELQKVTVRLKLEGEGSLYSTRRIQSPAEAVEVVSEELAGMDREYFCVVNLDAKGCPLNYNVVSIGDTAEVQVPIQNVFKTAVLSNASQILLFHNHPSSSLQPSYQDLSITKTLVEASKIMGIPIVDHIIVAGRSGLHCSMATMFPDIFTNPESIRYKAAETETQYREERAANDGTEGRYSVDHSTEERFQGTQRTKSVQGRRSLRERLAAKVAQAAENRQDMPQRKELRTQRGR